MRRFMHGFIPFWAFWTLAGLVGAGIGAALGLSIQSTILANQEGQGASSLLPVLVLMPSIGLGMGAAQWLVLKAGSSLRRSAWWILATAFGWLLGLSFDFSVSQIFPGGSTRTVQAFALAGLYLGALQWLVMYRQVRWGSLWILASIVAWGAAGGLIGLVAPLLNGGLFLGIALYALAGLLYGVLTGPVLCWLLRELE
jgi:hypothetical protein